MSSLVTETFHGAPGGMNLALPAHELDDTEMRYIQDAFVDFPGMIRARGPIRKVAGSNPVISGITPMKAQGIISTFDPTGKVRFALVYGDTSGGYIGYLADNMSVIQFPNAWGASGTFNGTPPSFPYQIVEGQSALHGGSWIGFAADYTVGSNMQLFIWRGANGSGALGNPSITCTRGSTTMTFPGGTLLTNYVQPGMMIIPGGPSDDFSPQPVSFPVVRSVDSNTQLTTMEPIPFGAVTNHPASNFKIYDFFRTRVVKGEITCDTGGTTVTGGKTKFKAQGLNGNWALYRQSDGAFIGRVSSVTSNTSLTLTANAAIAMASEAYLALDMITSSSSSPPVGFLTATYAERQWYANRPIDKVEETYRVWFSDPSHPFAVDLSADGDWFDVTSATSPNDPIKKLCSTNSGLMVFKEREVFLISGTDPSNFTVRKLFDDGIIAGGSVQAYGGGAIWAGRNAIYFFDGANVNIITSKLGTFWQDITRTFNPKLYRVGSFVHRDHYFAFLDGITSPMKVRYGPVGSGVDRTIKKLTVCVNMVTGAITLLDNLSIRGSCIVPNQAGQTVYYMVNGRQSGDASDRGYICDAEALFSEDGADLITCDLDSATYPGAISVASGGSTLGPNVYIETKKYTGGDGGRLKRWKQFWMTYLLGPWDNQAVFETMTGLDDLTLASTTNFLPTEDSIGPFNIFLTKKFRFMNKGQFVSFRLYFSPAALGSAFRFKIGALSIAYKLQRLGRV